MNQQPSPLAGWLGKYRKFHIPLLLLLAISVRIDGLRHFGLVAEGWREADNASIALNYYRNGFDLLHPQILWGGNGPGYVEMEFPLVQYVTAGLYKIFGVHEILGTVVPFVSALGAVVAVYGLASYFFGSAVGLLAAAVTAVSPPLVMYSTAFMVDPVMVLSATLAVYCFALWLETGRWLQGVISALSMAVAILVKPTALITGIPIAYLCFTRYGLSFIRQPRILLYGLLCLSPPILWYLHAHQLYAEFHNTFGILSGGMKKFATADVLFSSRFYELTLFRICVFHITPVAFCFMMVGMFTKFQDPRQYVFLVWCCGLTLYFIAVADGVMFGQYYLFPFVVPGSILAGWGVMRSFSLLRSRMGQRTMAVTITAAVTMVAFPGSVIGATYLFHLHRSPMTRYWEKEKSSGKMVGGSTEAGSLIIVANPQMNGLQPDQIMTPPEIFYFSDRRGWYLATSWVNAELVESLRKEGARYFVVSGNYCSDFRSSKPEVLSYLTGRFQTVVDNDDGIVVDLHGHAVESRNRNTTR